MSHRIIEIGADLSACAIERIERKFNKLVSKDPHKQVTFLFRNCMGGDVAAVLGFVDRVLASGTPIRTRNIGKIYSAGVVLFLVGERREGSKACEFKLHPFRINPEEVRFNNLEGDFAAWLGNARRLRVRVTRFIVDRTKLSVPEVFQFFSSDKYHFDMESAQKFGILRNGDPVQSKE